MIKRTICIKNYQNFNSSDTWSGHTGGFDNGELITWGLLTGITINGVVEYYTGQTESDANIAIIPILLISTIDDIGFYTPAAETWEIKTTYTSGNTVFYGENSYMCISNHKSDFTFNSEMWEITPNVISTSHIVTYTGETRINEFRRYGKTDIDRYLYNPDWNTGFTQAITTSIGNVRQITNQRVKNKGTDNQDLYDYKIWPANNTGATINYSDINLSSSIISYQSSGLTSLNSISAPRIKLDYLIGAISEPKISIDVFIDRGDNSSYDRHMKLGDVNSLIDLESYGNGYFKIKEI